MMTEPSKPTAIHYAFVISLLLCVVCAVGWLQAWQGINVLTNEKRRLVETGGFRGRPEEFEKELNSRSAALPVWWRTFSTEVQGIMPRPGSEAR